MTSARIPLALSGAALSLVLAAPGFAQQQATDQQDQAPQVPREVVIPGNTADAARNAGAAGQVVNQLEEVQLALEQDNAEAAREALGIAMEMLQKAAVEGTAERLLAIEAHLQRAGAALESGDLETAEAAIGAAALALIEIEQASARGAPGVTGRPGTLDAQITVEEESETEAVGAGPATVAAGEEPQPQLSTEETLRLLGTGDREIGQPAEAVTVAIGELSGRDVLTFEGERLGEIGQFVTNGEHVYAIVEHGGFLGIGEDKVAIPATRLGIRGGEVVLLGLTEEQLERVPEYDFTSGQALSEEQAIEIGRYD